MGILTAMFGQRRQRSRLSAEQGYGPTSDFWYEPIGDKITDAKAETYSAVWAATRIISETRSRLPLLLYRRVGDDGRERARKHPVYKLLHDRPNPEMLPLCFGIAMTKAQVNWGNAFAEIERNKLGQPLNLWPIHPSRVPRQNVKLNTRGEIVYHVINPQGAGTTPLPAKDMLHIPGMMSDDGFWGKGVLDVAATAIKGATNRTEFSERFYENDATPGGVLEHPGRLSPEAAAKLRDSWAKRHQGPANARKTAVLEEGMKYHQIDVSLEQAQFIETSEHDVTEIARFYLIPPHKLFDLRRATFSNITHQAIEFVDYVIPWMVMWEQATWQKLLTEEEQENYFAEHLVQALLKGDALSRVQFYKEMFALGSLTINDILRLENMNPIGPDGDRRFLPANNLLPLDQFSKSAPDEEEPTEDDDATPPETTEPVASQEEAAGMADVQATALNGAQIAGLLSITDKLVAGQLPKEGAAALLRASFPLMDEALIQTIVTTLDAFEPEEPEVPQDAPQPFGANPAEAEAGEVPPEDEAEAEEEMGQRSWQALTAVMHDTCQRMLRIEVNGLGRAAKYPNTFLSSVEDFYADYRGLLLKSLEPLLSSALAISGKNQVEAGAMAAAIADEHCQSAKVQLLDLSGTVTAGTLAGAVAELCTAWEQKLSAAIEERIR